MYICHELFLTWADSLSGNTTYSSSSLDLLSLCTRNRTYDKANASSLSILPSVALHSNFPSCLHGQQSHTHSILIYLHTSCITFLRCQICQYTDLKPAFHLSYSISHISDFVQKAIYNCYWSNFLPFFFSFFNIFKREASSRYIHDGVNPWQLLKHLQTTTHN